MLKWNDTTFLTFCFILKRVLNPSNSDTGLHPVHASLEMNERKTGNLSLAVLTHGCHPIRKFS